MIVNDHFFMSPGPRVSGVVCYVVSLRYQLSDADAGRQKLPFPALRRLSKSGPAFFRLYCQTAVTTLLKYESEDMPLFNWLHFLETSRNLY